MICVGQQKGVGIDGPLVDEEGYPRADIDVYAVRHARHRIACKCEFVERLGLSTRTIHYLPFNFQ